MKSVDLGDLFDPIRIVAMMCERMMRIGYADFRVNSGAAFPSNHERRYSSQISLKCHQLEVIHQLCILRKSERDAAGLVDLRLEVTVVLLSRFDSPLDLAYRDQVFIHLAAIG